MNSHLGYLSKSLITARFSATDFPLDGDLAKDPWSGVKCVRFDHNWAGSRHYPLAATAIASLWNQRYIYFAFWCRYSTLNVYSDVDPSKDFWGLWERDVVEVFVNPQPQRVNHYYEFEVAPNNLWIDLEIDLDKTPFNDPGWNSKFTHATHVDAGRKLWTCEMRIPLRAIVGARGTPSPGEEWRINFFRADGKGDNRHRRLMAWSPVPGEKPNFHTPRRFGLIRFEK
jgi:hypothetical protein